MPERINFYKNASFFAKIFSRLYLERPSYELLQSLRTINLIEFWPFIQDENIKSIFRLLTRSLNEDLKTLETKIKDDYMALFIGCGMPLAPLWASVYLDQENLLQRESTLRLQQFLHDANLSCTLREKQPVDNLGICFSALAVLLERAATDSSQQHIKDISFLLSVHICSWSGRCLELVRQNAMTTFYSTIAALTDALLTELLHKTGVTAEQHTLYY